MRLLGLSVHVSSAGGVSNICHCLGLEEKEEEEEEGEEEKEKEGEEEVEVGYSRAEVRALTR